MSRPVLSHNESRERINDAIFANNVDMLRAAFVEGAVVDNNPEHPNDRPNKTTIYYALNEEGTRNNPEFFRVLFENGMRVNNEDGVGMNSLRIALENNASREVLVLLIQNGASPESLRDPERREEMIQLREEEIPEMTPTSVRPASATRTSQQNIGNGL